MTAGRRLNNRPPLLQPQKPPTTEPLQQLLPRLQCPSIHHQLSSECPLLRFRPLSLEEKIELGQMITVLDEVQRGELLQFLELPENFKVLST